MTSVAPQGRDRELLELRRSRVLDAAPGSRFARITHIAQELFGVRLAVVSLVDRDELHVRGQDGRGPREQPDADVFSTLAMSQPGTLVIEDASTDLRVRHSAFVTGDRQVRFFAGQPLLDPSGRRLGTLSLVDTRPRTFSAADVALLRDLALPVEKELAVDRASERAAQVQASLLPRALPDLVGYEIAGRCLPARAVGGDFYDWHPVPGGLALTLADVMGKGAGAAIIAATVRAVLRGSSRRGDMAASLTDAEAALETDLVGTNSFVTAFHAKLAPETGTLTYADAGHGLTLLLRADGSSERLVSQGPPLGVVPGIERTTVDVHLRPGDLVLCFSDGVLDALGGGLGALPQVESAARVAATAEEAIAQMLWLLGASSDRPDDLTILALKRDAAPQGTGDAPVP